MRLTTMLALGAAVLAWAAVPPKPPTPASNPSTQRPSTTCGCNPVSLDDLGAIRERCRGGEAQSCVSLAELHESGGRIPRDVAAAARFWDAARRLNEGSGCRRLAWLYSQGEGVVLDPERAAVLFARGAGLLRARCEGGDAGACSYLGAADPPSRLRGPRRPPGFPPGQYFREVAVRWLERDCRAGDTCACGDLSVHVNLAEIEGARRAQLHGLACDHAGAGVPHAGGVCRWAAEAHEKLTPPDPERIARLWHRAVSLWETACLADQGFLASLACESLARAYADGRGVGRDPAQAARFHEDACDQGSASECLEAGDLFRKGAGTEQDARRAYGKWASLTEIECLGGSTGACRHLAEAHEKGDRLARSPGLSRRFYAELARRLRIGCRQGDAGACGDLGGLYQDEKHPMWDPLKAREAFRVQVSLFRDRCHQDKAWACCELADKYLYGSGVAENARKEDEYREKGLRLLRQACDRGERCEDIDLCTAEEGLILE